MSSNHPALTAGRAAVITGGAGGIGFAVAERLAGLGMKLVLADRDAERLAAAGAALRPKLAGGDADLRIVALDVSSAEEVAVLKRTAYDAFGEVAFLMNNAAIGEGGGALEKPEAWRRLLEINLFGVINGVQAFGPAIVAQGTPAVIVNTGSKQGITTPPGNAAYNVSKAGVKVLTEQLAHELRGATGGRASAHLLIPGWTFTPMTAPGMTETTEKPAGAWTAGQVADFLLAGLAAGDFYILCPDNDVTRDIDNKRMRWAMDDIILNRPALSRWHPDYKDAFADYMKS